MGIFSSECGYYTWGKISAVRDAAHITFARKSERSLHDLARASFLLAELANACVCERPSETQSVGEHPISTCLRKASFSLEYYVEIEKEMTNSFRISNKSLFFMFKFERVLTHMRGKKMRNYPFE